MSVRTCYVAQCDDCGKEYENGEYTPHWPSEEEAANDAESSGDWYRDGTQLLCENCAGKPHAFIASDFMVQHCMRCPHPEEDHEAKR